VKNVISATQHSFWIIAWRKLQKSNFAPRIRRQLELNSKGHNNLRNLLKYLKTWGRIRL